jgi:hypothetical protein
MRLLCALTITTLVSMQGIGTAADLSADIQNVRAVGPRGEGHERAVTSLKNLSGASAGELLDVLKGMQGTGPIARNWLRSAAESIVQRNSSSEKLPVQQLVGFLQDVGNDPHARRLAYEILTGQDETFAAEWKTKFLDDPSLELRRESVQVLLDDAKKELAASAKGPAGDKFGAALTAARDLDQIKTAADALGELGTKVDINDLMGFVTTWHLIAPFDNTDKSGFDVAYPPEKEVDLSASYKGKEGNVAWVPHTTSQEYGIVDLNEALDKHKGAIGYAYAEFHAAEKRDAEFRFGCINGNKVWLNGELLTANHVYHAGIFVDQYTATGQLKPGKNTILIKVAQNEQTDNWAQRWQFQLRVCDALGGAVKSNK